MACADSSESLALAAAALASPLALLRGTSVNQDGRSSSLTAPNGPAQQLVLRAALAAAAASPSSVDGLQMHGTGTALGDPIEVTAALAVFLGSADQALARAAPDAVVASRLHLTSLKASVGHAEPAAGGLGALAALHATLARSAAPLPHLRQLNPHVQYAVESAAGEGRVLLPRQPCAIAGSSFDAPGTGPPAALGVSSFAFQGTNAHALVSRCAHVAHSALSDARVAWQRERFWPLAPPLSMAAAGEVTGDGTTMSVLLAGRLRAHGATAANLAHLWDHRVLDRALLPATAFFEIALAAARALLVGDGFGSAALTAISIQAPLVLSAARQPVLVTCSVALAQGDWSISSRRGGTAALESHVSGAASLPLPGISSRRGGNAAVESHVSGAASLPLPAESRNVISLDAATVTDPGYACWARVVHPPAATTAAFCADPAMLDAAVHAPEGAARSAGSATVPRVPVAVAAYAICRGAGTQGTNSAAAVDRAALAPGGAARSLSCTLSSGKLAAIERLHLRSISSRRNGAAPAPRPEVNARSALAPSHGIMYNISWQAAPVRAAPRACAPTVGTSWRRSTLAAPASLACGLVAAHAAATAGRVQLRLVTCEAVPTAALTLGCTVGGARTLEGAALWGLLRALAHETPHSVTGGIDRVAASPAGGHASLGASDVLYGAALRGGGVREARLVTSAVRHPLYMAQLLPLPRGSLNALSAASWAPSPSRAGAFVVVRVRAVGLNFRDVLNVLGMYPGDPGPPGADCAGIVSSTNTDSGAVMQRGDAVFGLAPGALGTHVVASATTMAPAPASIALSAAAAMPTAYTTVDLALRQAVRCSAAGTVLVHAGTGAVGAAAAAVCGFLGARVIATAGTQRKRAFMRATGVSLAASSRGSGFVEVAAAATRAGGVGCVLNSLTSAGFVAATIACCSAGALATEISKRDIWAQGRVAQERRDISAATIALDFLPATPHVARMLRALAAYAAAGGPVMLPSSAYALGEARAAMRLISSAQQVGKVLVVALPQSTAALSGGVAITGGAGGGLGSLLAAWLASGGVGPLLLTGRNGRMRVGAAAAAVAWSSSCVTAVRCDAAAAEEQRAWLCTAAISSEYARQPCGALVHTSGVLADATVGRLSAAAARAVCAPKLGGAGAGPAALLAPGSTQPWRLRAVFSSVAALVGNAGQANYCAANAALDAWAARAAVVGAPAAS